MNYPDILELFICELQIKGYVSRNTEHYRFFLNR
jgi:hypothetical protein